MSSTEKKFLGKFRHFQERKILRKIFNTFSVLTLVSFFLASCETGRNGLNTESPVTKFVTYWIFSDGYGLLYNFEQAKLLSAKLVFTKYGSLEVPSKTTDYLYNTIADLEILSEVLIMEYDYRSKAPDRVSKLPLDQNLEHGELHLSEYGTGNDKVFLIFYSIPLYSISLGGETFRNYVNLRIWSFHETALMRVGGPKQAGNYSGSSQYKGLVGMNPRTTNSTDNFHHGTFSMSGNFDNGTGSIDATIGKLAKLKGDVSIDTEFGHFWGGDLVLTSESSTSKASIKGFFHGDSSEGITGVFYLETDSADGNINNHVGMIAGKMVN